ncbi:epsilon-sarcoglycan-like isoform X2 [Apostichopus japonicus]
MDTDMSLTVFRLHTLIVGLFIHTASSQQSVTQLHTISHQFFQHTLERDSFFDKFILGKEEQITFHPSLVTRPGLPKWLHFTQSHQTAPGYLYGTPLSTDQGRYELEIFGENLDTHESSRVLINIEVNMLNNKTFPDYHARLFIQNLNIEEILNVSMQEKLIDEFVPLWGQGSTVSIYGAMSAAELGLRNVVPINNEKQGVQVTVSSSQPPSSRLQENIQQLGCENDNPEIASFQYLNEFFDISWCEVTFDTITNQHLTSTTNLPIYLGGKFWAPSQTMDDSSDFIGFLLVVVVPSAILLAIVMILFCLMFCNRQGIEKRNQSTPEIQLAHHSMIRQASQELRSLSNRRDGGPTPVGSNTPQMAGTPNMRGKRTTSRAVLPHQTPPPPYRLPPEARKKKQETSFSNPRDSRRLSEPTQAKG